MHITIEFEKYPTVTKEVLGEGTPLEIRVVGGTDKGRKDSTFAYKTSLEYLFRGVNNLSSAEISRIALTKGWVGNLSKDKQQVYMETLVDKNFVVIYDIQKEKLTEHLYLADEMKYDKKTEQVVPIYNEGLLTPTKEIQKDYITYSIIIVNSLFEDYKLVFDGKLRVQYKGKTIKVEEIEDDEPYLIIQLLFAIINKNIHLGVIFVDCKGISDKTIEGFKKIADVYYKDTFIFLLNLDENSNVERDIIELPNLY